MSRIILDHITLPQARAILALVLTDLSRHLGYAQSAAACAAVHALDKPGDARAYQRDAFESLSIANKANAYAAQIQMRIDDSFYDNAAGCAWVNINDLGPWLDAYYRQPAAPVGVAS